MHPAFFLGPFPKTPAFKSARPPIPPIPERGSRVFKVWHRR